jgi:hypothetical protein
MKRRRITLQLTPLLDLLLVVIFAQYLQLKVVAGQRVEAADLEARSQIEAMEEEVQEAEKRRSDAEIQRSQSLEQLAAKDGALEEVREEVAALRERVRQYEADLQEQQRQHQADLKKLGETAAALFEVDAGLFEDAMKHLSPEETRHLREELIDLKGASSEAVIRHLREIDEIKKRCDIWEVHVSEEGKTFMRLPDMAEPVSFWVSDVDSFLFRAKKVVQDAAEPKSLVLILFSYGDATWAAREPVEDGVMGLRNWLRLEYEEKSFHVALMGYILSPP